MAFEESIRKASIQSYEGTRKGDTIEEIRAIQDYIRGAKIVVPNKNGIKVEVINEVLNRFDIPSAEYLQVNTNYADFSRMPAIAKAMIAVDQSDADLVIARGRLGIPGSGSFMVFMDSKSRILTAASSPSHVIHKQSLEETVYKETLEALNSEVFTVKSNVRLIDIFNLILEKKANAVLNLFNKLHDDGIINKGSSIVIIGTYFTGIAIAKYLSFDNFKDMTIVDIYPHLEGLIDSKLGNPIIAEMENEENLFKEKFKNIKCSSDLDLIKNADAVIDTTGLGGINESQSEAIFTKVFLIEDPIAEENDALLKDKNNIYNRANMVNSYNKYVLKTKGLNTKTSGTMTLAIDVLRQSMNSILDRDGVLYCASEMTFYEEIIFKEKDLEKFFKLIESPVLKVSTIQPFDCDGIINEFIDEIYSEILVRW